MTKRVFRLILRAAQGLIDSIFALIGVSLRCPDYSSISKRAKPFKTSTWGEITHLVINSTGLKLFSEGECKVKNHGLPSYLAVDATMHETICADLSLNIQQPYRDLSEQRPRTALMTPLLCQDELRRKKMSALHMIERRFPFRLQSASSARYTSARSDIHFTFSIPKYLLFLFTQETQWYCFKLISMM